MNERKFRWRPNSAVFTIVKNLEDIDFLLKFLFEEQIRISPLLDEHYDKFKESNSSKALDEFSKITERYSGAELSLRCSVDSAILLSVIDLESLINQFCYYNLGEMATDSIETLSMLNKMEIIHRVLNLEKFKGTKPYESLKSLVNWRNKYAHGKNSDMPSKPLRKNHIEQPEEYKNTAGDKTEELIKQIENYIVMIDYLETINGNEDIILGHSDHYWIEEYIIKFKKVRFSYGYPQNRVRKKIKNRLGISIINFTE